MPITTITGLDVVIPITYNGCPKNMTMETCPLRKHVANGKTVFYQDEDKLILDKSHKKSWEEIGSDYERMHEICTECQTQQKTK